MKADEKKKQQLLKSVYLVALVCFIATVVLIFFDIVRAFQKDGDDFGIPPKLLEPVDPELYLDLAQKLHSRRSFDAKALEQMLESVSTPVVSPDATDSGNTNETITLDIESTQSSESVQTSSESSQIQTDPL